MSPVPAWRIARWYVRRRDDGIGGWFGDQTQIEDFTCAECAQAVYDELLPTVSSDFNSGATLHGVELYPITLHPHTEEPIMPCDLHPTLVEKLKDWWRRRRPNWEQGRGGVAVA